MGIRTGPESVQDPIEKHSRNLRCEADSRYGAARSRDPFVHVSDPLHHVRNPAAMMQSQPHDRGERAFQFVALASYSRRSVGELGQPLGQFVGTFHGFALLKKFAARSALAHRSRRCGQIMVEAKADSRSHQSVVFALMTPVSDVVNVYSKYPFELAVADFPLIAAI